MLLNDKDREMFTAYCEQNLKTSKALLAQFEKTPGPAMEELAKRERLKMAAFLIVAADLRSGESV